MAKPISAFLVLLVITAPYAAGQMSPDEFFGIKIGGDRILVAYPGITRYFRHLDSTSRRIKVSDEGLSTLGNPIILACISSEENIQNLPRLMEINRRLADPDPAKAEETTALIDQARVFVLITATIHSTEIAASQMAMIFAHELAVTDNPDMESILDSVVILLMPSINPDGNVMVTKWYEKNLNTPYEGCRMPWLYHPYAGHDNNRDFFMLNLKETRVVNGILHKKYFPHVYLDMHQMGSTGPRMFVPPFKDPLNQNLDPLLLRETDLIGAFMAFKLQEAGKKGVGSAYAFDAYWPGGTKNTSWYKNVVGILTELASAKIATPVRIEANELRGSSKGLPEYKPQVNFPDPWPGGWWHQKDIIDYEMIAVNALVEILSWNRKSFLENFVAVGLKNIRKGGEEAPRAWVVPPVQWDEPCARNFLGKMLEHGVKLYRFTSDQVLDDRIYPKGSVGIPMDQPYRSFIQVMMKTQRFPEVKHMRDGPIIEPYDTAGWTLPLQIGVKTVAVNEPLDHKSLEPLKVILLEETTVNNREPGNAFWIPGRFNRSATAVNRLLRKGIPVFRAAGKDAYRTGDFVVKATDISEKDLLEVLRGTGVSVTRRDLGRKDGPRALKAPRIAIYQSWLANMDEGWTRWILDHYEFSYSVLHNKDFTNLDEKHDVLLFPDMTRQMIVEGKYSASRSYRSSSLPPEYQGGIGKEGVEAVKRFVESGGTVVLLDSASGLAWEDFGLPLTNVLKDVSRHRFYCPGSILRIFIDSGDPLGWGMEDESILFFSRSPAFRTRPPAGKTVVRKVVARFGNEGPHLLSGYLKGGDILNRTAAIVRFKYRDGHVIVVGGRVQHRAQTYATFKILFNALYFSAMD